MEFKEGDYLIDLDGKLMIYKDKDHAWHYTKGISETSKHNLDELSLDLLSTYCHEQASNGLTPYEIKGVDFNIKFQLDKVKEIIENRELDKNSKEFIIFEVNKLVDFISEKIKF